MSSTMSRRLIKPALELQQQLQQQQLQQQQQQQQQQHHHHQLQPPQQHLEPALVSSVPTDALDDVEKDLGVEEDETLSPTMTTMPPAATTRKRKAAAAATSGGAGSGAGPGTGTASAAATKRPRTNTPWTAAEEQRLKNMRDAGHSWSEIAKTFPKRTEGSVKKHWYKDMHYAEFGEDESAALFAAIREYDANKWKVIGQKVGKPAKACEQYAKEHFGKA